MSTMLAALAAGLEDEAVDIGSQAFADALDAADQLASARQQFHIPPTAEEAVFRPVGGSTIYLCGNSLGLQPKRTQPYVQEELDKWSRYGVEGHFRTERPWVSVEDTVQAVSARLVGAMPSEVAVMNSLTVNLHLLMVPFYRPTPTRYEILIEEHAFPSDTYAVKSQLMVHGHNPETDPGCFITVAPRPGEDLIRHEDILSAIAAAGDSLALVMWPGVQYYTGQTFDLPALCAAAHAAGAVFGLDLAHAVGNLPLRLHEWGVDFAAWCSYKYLNSGPGGIAGAFVHDRYRTDTFAERPYFAGWWGHRRADRFKMGPAFIPHEELTAGRLQLSNPAVLPMAALRASLDTFAEASAAAVAAGTAAAVCDASSAGGSASVDARTSAAAAEAGAAAAEAEAGAAGATSACAAPSAPSAPDASLMAPLRAKSLALTGYLEALLVLDCGAQPGPGGVWEPLRMRQRLEEARGRKPRAAATAAGEDAAAPGSASDEEEDGEADAAAAVDDAEGVVAPTDAGAESRELAAAAVRHGGGGAGAEGPEIRILTPADPESRGCQLSLVFRRPVRAVHDALAREGVICDMREPHVLRVAPVPLYTSASDVLEFVATLKLVLAQLD